MKVRTRITLASLLCAALAWTTGCTEAAAETPHVRFREAGDAGPGAEPGDAGTVRFIAVGDTGHGNTAQFQVGAAMGKVCADRGCDFVVLLGDNFYSTGVGSTTDPQWQSAFVRPYATVNVPFYAVLGNHDYGAYGVGTDFPRILPEIDYSKVNPKWRMPAAHYQWSADGVDFFAADTNRSSFRRDRLTRADLDGWIAASTARWKIVFGHHPYLSNGPHGNAGHYDQVCFFGLCRGPGYPGNGQGVKEFLDHTVCGKADVYISGHDHSRQWQRGTCQGTELIVSGAGSQPTSLNHVNPTYFQSDHLGFLYVVISGDAFTGTFYDASGVPDFSRTLLK